jgi:hypothetical protein
VGPDRVETGDWCLPVSVDDLMVSQKDVAAEGHFVGELAMSHRPLVSGAEDLAMADDERGYWPPI